MKKIFSVLFLFLAVYRLYGQEKLTDKRDGSIYKTMSVQGVVWMAENLRYKAPEGSFYFDNNPVNLSKYGMLYEWKTAVNACPDGWRLPSGQEYHSLLNYLEEKNAAKGGPAEAKQLGFQLGGMQDYEGTFTEMEESAYYWTSTEYDKENAEYFSYLLITDRPVADISRKEDIEDIHGAEKTNKYSVRCVKR